MTTLQTLFSPEQKKSSVILLITPVLLTVFAYYGTRQFYLNTLQSLVVIGGNPEWTAALYVFGSSLILFGLVPLLIIRFYFRESLSSYGLQWGDWSFGWKATLVVACVFLLSTYPSSNMPDFLAQYPLYSRAGESPGTFGLHALSYLLYYVGWELYFRGFLQFGLRSSLGDWNAILVQVLASCLVHIGKPAGETFTSILGGLLWGLLAFRTRSIFYGIATHWVLGISLDFFIVYL